jgi:DnaJ-class molecular chaperone
VLLSYSNSDMANFDEIDEARRLLELGEQATLKQIKSAYRKMAFRYHPDKRRDADSSEHEEIMKKLNWAYKVLLQYCHDYKYTFGEEDIARTYPYEEHLRKWREKWFNSI